MPGSGVMSNGYPTSNAAAGPFSTQPSGPRPVGCFSALLARPVSIQIWALYRQSGSDRLEKQPTDLRRHHHYMRDGTLGQISDPGSVRNHGILRYHNHTIADVVIGAVDVGCFPVGCNHDAFTDSRVLVDDCAIDHGVPPNPNWREQSCIIFRDFGCLILVIVCTHDDGIPNGRSALNDATYADDRPLDMCIRNDATVTDDRVADRCGVDFTGRKKPGMSVNWS